MSRPADPLLTVFPSSVLRAILCGGEGLPAAWGPLECTHRFAASDGQWVWGEGHTLRPDRRGFGFDTLTRLGAHWRLPLEHWRARLARVSAWMLGAVDVLAAAVVVRSTGLSLWVWPQGDEGADPPDPTCYRWALDGEADAGGGSFYDLPSLPVHMRDHDPHIALLLALYDVPEIRARVEAVK